MTAWILVLVAGIFEIIWAGAMKASDGFTRPGPSILTVAAMIVSFWLLSMAMKQLPLGTAYAVWVGIGAVGTAVVGIVLFGEAASPMRIAGIALIAAGIAALKFA
jgi:quaternary ammonium compound-resistance protein SugE